MKEECDRRVEEARKDIEYTGGNSEQDEEKLAILLNSGTQVLKIKSLERAIKSKDKELEALRTEKISLQSEVEKVAKTNEEIFAQNEELQDQNLKQLSQLAGKTGESNNLDMQSLELENERESHKKTHILMTDYLSQLKDSQAENTKLVQRVQTLDERIQALEKESADATK